MSHLDTPISNHSNLSRHPNSNLDIDNNYKDNSMRNNYYNNKDKEKDDRSPNPKLARYLHRIQQLVGNRGRTPSPLSNHTPNRSRIATKPLRTSSLDYYLKYELTIKILCNFVEKRNKEYMRYFMYLVRDFGHGHDPHGHSPKVEKIYKFVPIQKTQCAHMIIDTGISTKMMGNLLKSLLKNRLRNSFQLINKYSTSNSAIYGPINGNGNTSGQFMIDSGIGLGGLTGRSGKSVVSNRSGLIPLSHQNQDQIVGRDIDMEEYQYSKKRKDNANVISVIMLKIFFRKMTQNFHTLSKNSIPISPSITHYSQSQSHQPVPNSKTTQKITSNPNPNPDHNQKNYHNNNHHQHNHPYKIKILKPTDIEALKYKYFGEIFGKIKKFRISDGMRSIRDNIYIIQQVQNEDRVWRIKLANIVGQKYSKNKNQMLQCIKLLSKAHKAIQSKIYLPSSQEQQQQQSEVIALQNPGKISTMLSTSHKNHNNKNGSKNSNILANQFVSNMNVILSSVILRRKIEFLRALEKIKKKDRFPQIIVSILSKKILIKHIQFFQSLNHLFLKSQILPILTLKNWQSISILLNLPSYLHSHLRTPYEKIVKYSEKKKEMEEKLEKVKRYWERGVIAEGFRRIFRQSQQKEKKERQVSILRQKQKEQEKIKNDTKSNNALNENVKYLPKLLHKLNLLRLIDTFIKIKHSYSNKSVSHSPTTQYSHPGQNHPNLRLTTTTTTTTTTATISNTNTNKNQQNNTKSKTTNKKTNQWALDIQNFISERENFNNNILENYRKLETMISNANINANMAPEQSITGPGGIGTNTNTNNNTNTNSSNSNAYTIVNTNTNEYKNNNFTYENPPNTRKQPSYNHTIQKSIFTK